MTYPTAAHKLDVSSLRHRDVFQSYFSEDEGGWAYDQRDGLLLYRSVFTALQRPSSHQGQGNQVEGMETDE